MCAALSRLWVGSVAQCSDDVDASSCSDCSEFLGQVVDVC